MHVHAIVSSLAQRRRWLSWDLTYARPACIRAILRFGPSVTMMVGTLGPFCPCLAN